MANLCHCLLHWEMHKHWDIEQNCQSYLDYCGVNLSSKFNFQFICSKKMPPFIYLDECNLPLSHHFSEMVGNFILCISSNPCQDHAMSREVSYTAPKHQGGLVVSDELPAVHPTWFLLLVQQRWTSCQDREPGFLQVLPGHFSTRVFHASLQRTVPTNL